MLIVLQNYHNAVYREEEREMIPLLQDLGVAMIPWSPMARGFLTHPIAEETVRTTKDKYAPGSRSSSHTTNFVSLPYSWMAASIGNPDQEPFMIEVNKRVHEIATARGVSMAQVAIAWSLSKPFMTAPIVGTTSLKKLEDSAGE